MGAREEIKVSEPNADLAWIAKLSDKEWNLVKTRYRELLIMQQKFGQNHESEGRKTSPSISNLAWLAELDGEKWSLVKQRLDEFFSLTFKSLLKNAAKLEVDGYKEALALEVLKEIANDTTLPLKLRSAMRKELDEAKKEQLTE